MRFPYPAWTGSWWILFLPPLSGLFLEPAWSCETEVSHMGKKPVSYKQRREKSLFSLKSVKVNVVNLWDPFSHIFFVCLGAESSGDIDILLTHTSFTSTGGKKVKFLHLLRWMNMLGRFSAIFWQGRQLLWFPVCFTVHQSPSERGLI